MSQSIPIELATVFKRYTDAKTKFDGYSPSHQREYVKYVLEAKKSETRARRADRVIMMLSEHKLTSVYKLKTIPEIFGLQPDMNTQIINPPKDYKQIMSGWKFAKTDPKNPLDFVHLFVKNQAQLKERLSDLIHGIKPTGMIWVSWPKKAAGAQTDVNENTIRELALQLGLVDVKVCAVSDIWSGLKLIIPLKNRKQGGNSG